MTKNHILLVILLILIILPSAGVTLYFGASTQVLLELTDRVLASIEEEDWQTAEGAMTDLRGAWEERKNLWSLLMDHRELHDLELVMARTQELVTVRDRTNALAELQAVRVLIKNIGERQIPNLVNIL